MEGEREPGPLEKELTEAMERGILGTSLVLRLSTGSSGEPASNVEAIEQLFDMHSEIHGLHRRMILRLAREIDDLRATND